MISRRTFLQSSTVAALAATVARLRANPYGWPIGCQTFPYGKAIDADFPGTMKMLATAGIQSIELCSPWYSEHNFGFGSLNKISAAEFKRVIGDVGLTCFSSHVDMTECRNKLPWLIDWARERGITQIIVPSLDGPTKEAKLDDVKRLADEYNRIGAISAKSGLQQGMHHEGFENQMIEGRRVFDMLFELIDPKAVKFQFQMSTVRNGMIAEEYFTKYPGRFVSMHLQDVDMNAPVPPPPAPAPGQPAGRGRAGGPPTRPIGQGSIDWVKTFRAAKIGGVQNFFIEMNEELMKASVPYLKQLSI